MDVTIKNSFLTVGVKQHGAELCSIKSAAGVEYLWQADPKIWPRHAPLLFPVVGKLVNDRYSFEGKTYSLTQHGFARDLDFEFVDRKEDAVSYRLLPSVQTLERYPFDFELRVRYRLDGAALGIGFEVNNNGNDLMPFSIGAHPGFSLAWGEGDRLEDYYLEFARAEPLDVHFLGASHLLASSPERVLLNGTRLPLRKDLFDRDALLLLDGKSKALSLCSNKYCQRLTVEYAGFPHLGIWAKPGAPFVCIEPWYGHVDPEEHDGVIMNKPGIIKLKAGGTFRCEHRVRVE